MLKKLAISSLLIAGLTAASAAPVLAASCKKTTAQGWGVTKELAKWQAQGTLLFATGNWVVQNDKFSKPVYDCSVSLLGWSCKASAKICKK
ncbi:MAG: hypothetical protein DHS20C08_15540 [Rhodomicrobium sp.]|nr:MAG: hypothetical protein DHS20C08_15540 [Rhodomicrobium sp.]